MRHSNSEKQADKKGRRKRRRRENAQGEGLLGDEKLRITSFFISEMRAQEENRWPLFKGVASFLFTSEDGKLMREEIFSKYGLTVRLKPKTLFEKQKGEEEEEVVEGDCEKKQGQQEDGENLEKDKWKEKGNLNVDCSELELVSKPLICFSCGVRYHWGYSVGKNECKGHYYAPLEKYNAYPCCRAPYVLASKPSYTFGLPYCTQRDHSVHPTNARDVEKIPVWLLLLVCDHFNVSPQNIVDQALKCHLICVVMMERKEDTANDDDDEIRRARSGEYSQWATEVGVFSEFDIRLQSINTWDVESKVNLLHSYVMLPYMLLHHFRNKENPISTRKK